MRAGDTVILVVSGPTDDGIARLTRINAVVEDSVVMADGKLFRDSWALDEGNSAIRHHIEADTPERRSYYRL